MRGAHERNVLRWEARLALLDARIARLERELARANPAAPPEQRAQAARELEQARHERAALGPAPHPKMG
ncbi:MAG TPA: hypothetical protein VID73_00155 [Ktedonobacterales bacterium]|jgi:hypothetical protein